MFVYTPGFLRILSFTCSRIPRRPVKKLVKPSPPPAAAAKPSPPFSTAASDESPADVPDMKAVQEAKKATDTRTTTPAVSDGEAVVNAEDVVVVPGVEVDGEGPTAGNMVVGDSEQEPEVYGDDPEEEEDVMEEDAEVLGEQKGEIKIAVTGRSGDGDASVKGDDTENNGDIGSQDANNDNEVNASALHADNPLTERKDQMELEIHVSGLHKGTVDEDLLGVFGVFGEIESIRLIKYPKSGRCKGYAFIHYKTAESVKKVMEEFEDGTEIKGKKIKISVWQDNVVCMRSICKTWTGNYVKTVYLDGIPSSWYEDKIKETCKQYGEIESVWLSKYFPKRSWKIGFVVFTSQESAFSCIEGINNTELKEWKAKVRAAIATPDIMQNLTTQDAKGDFIVQKDKGLKDDTSNKSKEIDLSEEKVKEAKKNEALNVQSKQIEGKAGVCQAEKGLSAKGKKLHEREIVSVVNQGEPKKARNDRYYGQGLPSTVYGNPSNFNIAGGYNFMVPAINASSYFQPARRYNHHAFVGASRPIAQRADLEPHAGYLPPAEKSLDPFSNNRRRIQERTVASYGAASVPQTLYHRFSGHSGYEVGYGYPSGRPHAHPRDYY